MSRFTYVATHQAWWWYVVLIGTVGYAVHSILTGDWAGIALQGVAFVVGFLWSRL